jgi:F0F1-type ATP synthase membrane subunit b/b'
MEVVSAYESIDLDDNTAIGAVRRRAVALAVGAAAAILRKSTSSRVADRAAIEDALVKAGVALTLEDSHG